MQLGDLKSAMERYRQLKQSQAQGQLPVQQNPDMLRQSMQARPRQAGMLETMMGVGRQFREDPLNALKVMANRAISGPEMPVTTGLEPGPFEKFIGEASRRGAGMQQGFLSGTVPEFLAKHNAPGPIQEIAKVGGAVAGTASEIIAQQFDEGNPAFSQAAFGFHGTPHKFNKFDIKKIGTGEGHQAYGHGLYFAENPKVAGDYAAQIKDMGAVAEINDELSKLAKIMSKDTAGEYGKFRTSKGVEASKKYDELLSKRDTVSKDPGQIYKVDIPDEKVAGMLDWDKPLSEQSESIRKGVESAIRDVRGGNKEITLELVSKNLGGNPTGADFYRMIAGTPEKSTQALQKQGIPGIKYLDQGSRQAGSGTRNIVAFDDKIVNILEVNGKKVQK